eukprot:Hpha_TRINITY_DN17547_c0_g1::TRINITY_DN17547_c0_g1_i1::g.92569::m.92569
MVSRLSFTSKLTQLLSASCTLSDTCAALEAIAPNNASVANGPTSAPSVRRLSTSLLKYSSPSLLPTFWRRAISWMRSTTASSDISRELLARSGTVPPWRGGGKPAKVGAFARVATFRAAERRARNEGPKAAGRALRKMSIAMSQPPYHLRNNK